MANIRIYFSIFIISSIDLAMETSCNDIDDPIYFTQKTEWADSYELSEQEDDECIAYHTFEARKKLCYYAKLETGVSYLDYDYVPYWHEYAITTYIPEFHYGMHCATIPRIRVLLHCRQDRLQIRSTRSYAHYPKFNADVIKANSVSGSIEQSEEKENERKSDAGNDDDETMMVDRVTDTSGDEDSPDDYSEHNSDEKIVIEEPETKTQGLSKMKTIDRTQLCLNARDYLSTTRTLNFLHHRVPKAEQYEFEDAGELTKKIYTAILCPTMPKLYLRDENVDNELRLVLLHGLIDDYQFEVEQIKPMSITKIREEEEDTATKFPGNLLLQLKTEDRFNLCVMARRNNVFSHVPFISDEDVTEAHVYAFEYRGKEDTRHVAIQCMAIPSIYLHEDESSERTNKIIITFVETVADHYVYKVEVAKSLNIVTAEAEEGRESGPIINSVPAEHPFTTLDEESRWSLCWAAQKYILNDPEKRWKFRFTTQERVLSDFKLLLIPEYMKNPQMYQLDYEGGESEQDTIIQCSAWPKMYVRLGDSSHEIKIVLQEIRYLVK